MSEASDLNGSSLNRIGLRPGEDEGARAWADAVRHYCDPVFDALHDRLDALETQLAQRDDIKAERILAGLDSLRDRMKHLEARPHLRFAGQYREDSGTAYAPGDLVTSGGSLWACAAETSTRPGAGNEAWCLAVRKGRDGKEVQP